MENKPGEVLIFTILFGELVEPHFDPIEEFCRSAMKFYYVPPYKNMRIEFVDVDNGVKKMNVWREV